MYSLPCKNPASYIIDYTTRLYNALHGLDAVQAERELRKFTKELHTRIEKTYQIDSACIEGLDQAWSAYVTDDVRASVLDDLRLAASAQSGSNKPKRPDERLQAIARINVAWGKTIFEQYNFAKLGRPTAVTLSQIARAYPHWLFAVQRINVAMLSRHIKSIRQGTGLIIGHHHKTSKNKESQNPIEIADLKLILAWKERGEIDIDDVCLPDVGNDIPQQLQSLVNEWTICDTVPLAPSECKSQFSSFHLLSMDSHQLLVPRPREESSKKRDRDKTTESQNKKRSTENTSSPRNDNAALSSQAHLGPDATLAPNDNAAFESQAHPGPDAPAASNDSAAVRNRAASSTSDRMVAEGQSLQSQCFKPRDEAMPERPTSPHLDPPAPKAPNTPMDLDPTQPLPENEDDLGYSKGHGRPETSGKKPMLRPQQQHDLSPLFVGSSDESECGSTSYDSHESLSELENSLLPMCLSPRSITAVSVTPDGGSFAADMQEMLDRDNDQNEDSTSSQTSQNYDGLDENGLSAGFTDYSSFFNDEYELTTEAATSKYFSASPSKAQCLNLLSEANCVIQHTAIVGGPQLIAWMEHAREARVFHDPPRSTSCHPNEAEIQCLTYDACRIRADTKAAVSLPTIVQGLQTSSPTLYSEYAIRGYGGFKDVTQTHIRQHGNIWFRNLQGTHLCVVASNSFLGIDQTRTVFLGEGDILFIPHRTPCAVVTFDDGTLQTGLVSERGSDVQFTADRLFKGLADIKFIPESLF